MNVGVDRYLLIVRIRVSISAGSVCEPVAIVFRWRRVSKFAIVGREVLFSTIVIIDTIIGTSRVASVVAVCGMILIG